MIKTALLCLSLTIYFEARGEPEQGMYAVAEVVTNRAKERGKSVCDVVYEKNQFSWVKGWNGKLPEGKPGWEKSVSIAHTTLETGGHNYTNGATYFHSKKVKRPNWKAVYAITIGNHVFYKRINS